MNKTQQIQQDLLLSTLFFLDKFYITRALQDKLRDHLNAIRSSIQNLDLSLKTLPYQSIEDLKIKSFRPALLRCTVNNIESPKTLIPQSFREYLTDIFHVDYESAIISHSIALQAQSPAGDALESLRITNEALTKKINQLKEKHTVFDLVCFTVPFPSQTGKTSIHMDPHLVVLDIRPVTTPLQLLQAEEEDISKAKTILEKVKKEKGVFNYIRNSLIRRLKIANIERNPHLNIALSAVVIQAFSDGRINNSTSGKISCLVVGAPGSGKKLISQCAKVINPVFTQAEPSKLTIPGICSSTQKKMDVWVSNPGLIPLGSLGTFNLQDFHIISPAKKQAVTGALYRVLEDGIIYDSTSAHIEHEALTSILIDTNKSSDLRPDQRKNISTIERRLKDINIPLPVLSRFDFCVDIPRDVAQQIDIALAVHDQKMTIAGQEKISKKESDSDLKLLVAYLREKHRDKLQFSKKIKEYIKTRQKKLIDEYRPLMFQYEYFSDFQIRMSISIYRFTAAVSIMNDRRTPTKEDVDFAFTFVSHKMSFVKSLVEETENEKMQAIKIQPKRKERQKWILKYFAGTTQKIGHLLKEYNKFYGHKINSKTLRVDLQSLHDKGVEQKQKGYYYIPEKREQKIQK